MEQKTCINEDLKAKRGEEEKGCASQDIYSCA
jgi:hypothetical protein